MNNANKCPNCKRIIFGTYCANCHKNISEFVTEPMDMPDIFRDIFDVNNNFFGWDD